MTLNWTLRWGRRLFPQDYVAVKESRAVFVPHTAGRYAQQRFRKAQCPIVERVVNSMVRARTSWTAAPYLASPNP